MKSIIQIDDKCFYCHRAVGTEWHHIFGGNPGRRFSEADGEKVLLCRKCHDDLHFDKDRSAPMQKALHTLGQVKWEAYYGQKLEQEGKDPRKAFMERYGKNYL